MNLDPNEQLSPHFKRGEFACKNGCGFDTPDHRLVEALEELRELVGKPILIHDACRCPAHNAECKGAKSSQHLLGTAADIAVQGMTARELYAVASTIPEFGGFGVSDPPGTYIHVDVRAVPAKWAYDEHGAEIPWHSA